MVVQDPNVAGEKSPLMSARWAENQAGSKNSENCSRNTGAAWSKPMYTKMKWRKKKSQAEWVQIEPCKTTSGRLRKGSGPVCSGDGMLLTATKDVVDWWREYLLNLTEMPSRGEAGPSEPELDSPMSRTEVAKAVKKLLDDRAPGVDEIPPEFLKALDIRGTATWLADQGCGPSF